MKHFSSGFFNHQKVQKNSIYLDFNYTEYNLLEDLLLNDFPSETSSTFHR